MLVLLVACAPPPVSNPNDSGSEPAAVPAPPAAAVTWLDATGAEVDGVIETLGAFGFVDDAGLIWALDLYTSGADALSAFHVAGDYSDAADCSSSLVAPLDALPVNYVAALDDGSGWVVPDPDADLFYGTLYQENGDNCYPVGIYHGWTAVLEVGRPVPTWTPPLRPAY